MYCKLSIQNMKISDLLKVRKPTVIEKKFIMIFRIPAQFLFRKHYDGFWDRRESFQPMNKVTYAHAHFTNFEPLLEL